MTLRRGLIILALFVAIFATWQIAAGNIAGWYAIAVAALIVVGALVFERPRYRPTVTSSDGWRATEERFVDPVSGKLTEVYFNPQTGEREYRPPSEGA